MICLIRLPALETFRFTSASVSAPLGLAYIAGALEDSGREIAVVDAVGEAPRKRTKCFNGILIGMCLEDIVAAVPEATSIIGISVIFTHEWPVATKLIDLLKRRHPNAKIVLGGEHVTAMPDYCLLTSDADVLVLGEGEETVVEVVDALERGSTLSPIKGIAFRDGAVAVTNSRRSRRKSIDDIPLPAWDHFKLALYTEQGLTFGLDTGEVTVPILATRGCPYQCTYCSSPNMWTTRWYPRDPKSVVDEIELYVEKYGARNFPFQDLTAILKNDWIVEFCHELLRRDLDITWQLPNGTRCEAIDDEVAPLLKKTGMINASFAPETGSEEVRKAIKKRMNTESLMRSIRAAIRSELNISCFLVIGFPEDDERSMADTLAFVERLAKEGVTDIGINYYMALPGTEMFRRLEQKGRIELNQKYFGHILESLAPIPSLSYCENLTRLDLMYWKFRFFFRFYRTKILGIRWKSVFRSAPYTINVFLKKKSTSRLRTVVSYASRIAWDEFRVRFKKPWILQQEQEALFQSLESEYRELTATKLKYREEHDKLAGAIQLNNIIPLYKREHASKKVSSL